MVHDFIIIFTKFLTKSISKLIKKIPDRIPNDLKLILNDNLIKNTNIFQKITLALFTRVSLIQYSQAKERKNAMLKKPYI